MAPQAIPALHPAARILPLMSTEDYAALLSSIREHGQLEPCVLHGGLLLDGRHRWQACLELGIEPKVRQYADECGGSPTAYVVSVNVPRRHLTPSQRATVAAEMLPELQREAKERQRASGPASVEKRQHDDPATRTQTATTSTVAQRFAQPSPDGTPISPQVRTPTKREPEAAQQAAKAVGTNRPYVEAAATLKEKAPDLFQAVHAGEKTIPAAKRELERRESDQQETVKSRAVDPDGSKQERRRLRELYRKATAAVDGLIQTEPATILATFDSDGEQRAFAGWIKDTRVWLDRAEAAMQRGIHLVTRETA